ncbi:MAG: lysozyme inhibitor LprI family protein [Alphaproteobacteria bacterium]
MFCARNKVAGLALAVIWFLTPDSRAEAAPEEVVAKCIATATDGLAAQTACISLVANTCLADPSNTALDEKIECVQREFVVWDRMMKHEYAALRANLDGPAIERVTKAQQRWVAFQKKNCRVPYALFSGAEAALGGPWCSVNEFAFRAISLRAWRRSLGIAPPG